MRIGVGVLVGAGAITCAAAFASGANLVDKSKPLKVANFSLGSKTISCGNDGRAAALGFEGAASITASSDRRVLLPFSQTLDTDKGQVTLASFGDGDQTGTAHVYCGGPKLVTAKKAVDGDQFGAFKLTARCKGSATPYSGGFDGPDSGSTEPASAVVGSYRSSAHSWTVQVFNTTSTTGRFTAYAYCRAGKPLTARSKTRTLAQRQDAVVVPLNINAHCKAGEHPISGGFRPRVTPNTNGPVVSSSYLKNKSTWQVRAADLGQRPDPSRVTSYVYCQK